MPASITTTAASTGNPGFGHGVAGGYGEPRLGAMGTKPSHRPGEPALEIFQGTCRPAMPDTSATVDNPGNRLWHNESSGQSPRQ